MHVGKVYPRTAVNMIQFPNENLWGPPRFRRMAVLVGAIGTDAVKFTAGDHISLPCEREGGVGPRAVWVWESPSDPTVQVREFALLRPISPVPISNPKFEFELEVEFWSGATLLAHQSAVRAIDPFWTPSLGTSYVQPWLDRVDLAKFTQLPMTTTPAAWSYVPFYHPYRH